MEPEVQALQIKRKRKKIIPILFLVVILAMFLSATVFAYLILQNDTVYKGVYVGSYDASGLSMDELQTLLEQNYRIPSEKLSITLKTPDTEVTSSYPELNVRYDLNAAAENAYSLGRTGNIFERLYNIGQAALNSIRYEIPQTYEENKIDSFVGRFAVNAFKAVKEGALLITEDSVIIRSGSHGEYIEKDKTAKLVKDMIKNNKGGIIEPELIVTRPSKFNIDDLYNQIISDPADASYKLEESDLIIIPHSVGRKIEKSQLSEIITALEQKEGTERLLPVTFIKPVITSDIISSFLFRDQLATMSTTFSSASENGRNRKHNMIVAIKNINNLILMPGEEFSFNKVVGPRDVEHGYKTAHVYIRGRIEDGIGGGICQVSTTMYNAVLKADLQVVERKSHSFTVGYVPLGQDATAYYGGTDFRFLNSTKWPMKLTSVVSGNKISFTITGTNEIPGKTVIISNKVLKETPHEIKKIPDATLPFGTTKEKQEGLNGYIVETFKTIKLDGKVISQKKLHTSRYNPCTQEILVGTKGAPPATPPGEVITAPEVVPVPDVVVPAAPEETDIIDEAEPLP